MWTFLTEQWSRSGCHSVKESPHKSSLFRHESITKLSGGSLGYIYLFNYIPETDQSVPCVNQVNFAKICYPPFDGLLLEHSGLKTI